MTATATPDSQSGTPLPQDVGTSERVAADDGDIVVTALRREQSILTVPIAISAIAGNTLASKGITNSANLAAAVPNLQVSSPYGSTQPNFSLRGISVANEYNSNQASPIGVYIDDVYLASRTAHGMGLFDLERVEVLRGPQGTLFGRNTTGGAINFITKGPTLGGNEGYAEGGYGNFTPILPRRRSRRRWSRINSDCAFRAITPGATARSATPSPAVVTRIRRTPCRVARSFVCARATGRSTWQFARWRQFIGSYELPALVDPVFVVHVGGKPDTRLWEADHWSNARSIPGCATIVPAGCSTGWRIDGELDVVTVSVPLDQLQDQNALDHFRQMRFAFADPLGIALTRQILGELYAPETTERVAYIGTLLDALKAHTLRGPSASNEAPFPSADFSAYRIHQIMNEILGHPEQDHSLEALSAQAGLTPSHFCRVFKRATGATPHQFVMKARLDRAQNLLGQSDLSVAQVAEMTGFMSQSHFTRAFRQYAGQTPSGWRQTLQ